jgi:hypothetical protein
MDNGMDRLHATIEEFAARFGKRNGVKGAEAHLVSLPKAHVAEQPRLSSRLRDL